MYKKKARIITPSQAKEEDLEYFLKLSPADRLRELQKLRVLNFGEAASAPMTKTIRLIKKES